VGDTKGADIADIEPGGRHHERHRLGLNLAATLTASTACGLAADHWVPNPIAVMVVIGSVVACAATPLICPAPDPPEEDT
jgi:hypothetical protein